MGWNGSPWAGTGCAGRGVSLLGSGYRGLSRGYPPSPSLFHAPNHLIPAISWLIYWALEVPKMLRNVATAMGMVTLSICASCKGRPCARGLYCVECHNAYRSASRRLKTLERKMGGLAWKFLLKMAYNKHRKEL